MNLGQQYSTSPDCGWVRFVGGPYDGQQGFFDNNRIDQISFSHAEERATHSYRPEKKGVSWNYIYIGPYHWNEDWKRWFWWCHDQSSLTA